MTQCERVQLYGTHFRETVTLLMREAEPNDTRTWHLIDTQSWRELIQWMVSGQEPREAMPHFGPANILNFHQRSLTPHEACFEDDCDGYARFNEIILY